MPKKNDYSYQAEQDVHRITLYNTVYPEHQHRHRKDRLYLHFDFACFYAQVEQLRKNMYGIPLIVGGWRKENGTVKGIVATSSYEARSMGIKTGMSAYEAYKRCPYVCMLQVDYASYTAISTQVHHIMNRYSHQIERYSMDEYFMDASFLLGKEEPQIRTFAQQLQRDIVETTIQNLC
jgi:DNA polymerase IV